MAWGRDFEDRAWHWRGHCAFSLRGNPGEGPGSATFEPVVKEVVGYEGLEFREKAQAKYISSAVSILSRANESCGEDGFVQGKGTERGERARE